MACEIIMPQLGLTMTEGSVNAWIKQPGERVQKGEMLFTVSTDKVDMEVESTGSGFLNTVVELGRTVPVGTVIAVLTDRQDEPVLAPAKAEENGGRGAAKLPQGSPAEAVPAMPESARERQYPASPRARTLAKNLGLDIAEVVPASGSRIVEADIKRHHETRKAEPRPEPMSAVKRITAERTSQSFERAPHFYLGREVNARRLVTLRDELQTTAQRKLGFKITYTDFLVRALALAVGEEKTVNAQWENGTVVSRQSVDIAFAAQTEKGLLTPVITNADALNFFETAARRKDLSDRARQGKLQPAELQGGSATLSNLGAHGVDWFQAILNPPQSVILAAGGIAKRPAVIDGSLAVADTLILSLSADHRVLDGVVAAKFLSAVVRMLENPFELLV